MKKKLINIGKKLMLVLSIPMIIGVFVYANTISKHEVCKGVNVLFENNQESFVTKENISTLLKKNGFEINKTMLCDVNIHQLENDIKNNKWIEHVDVFVTANNELNIRIEQKAPIVRIQPENDFEEAYYLDKNANVIPYSSQYIPNLPVVTTKELGYESEDFLLKNNLIKIANFIQNDTFWSAAITQISVNENRRIDLIPAFGSQIIILGNADNLENKMSKLFKFYQQGLETVRWDKYDEIDLRFEKQIVCRNNRGEKLSIDPNDKSTHKELLANKNSESSKSIQIAAKPIVNPIQQTNQIATKPSANPIQQTKKESPSKQIIIGKNKNEVQKTTSEMALKPSNKKIEVSKVKTINIEKETLKPSVKSVSSASVDKPKETNTKQEDNKIKEIKNSKFFNEKNN